MSIGLKTKKVYFTSIFINQNYETPENNLHKFS